MAEEDEPTQDSKHAVAAHSYSTKNSSGQYLLFGLAGLAILAVVFCAGIAVQRHHNNDFKFAAGPFMGMHEFGGGRRFGGRANLFNTQNGIELSGKITAVNGSNFTLDQNGSSKTIKTDSNTRFGGVGISGLQSGDQVNVAGTANSDGSVQALNVIVTSATNNPST